MLTQLPQELLELICKQCTQESLRNLRLVDKRTNTSSTPLVFERMYVSTFTNSIAKLGHLSRSLLSKHVKAIDFIPDRLPAWNKRDWTKAVDFRPPFSTWCLQECGVDISKPSKDEVLRIIQDRSATDEKGREWDRLPRHSFTQDQMMAGWLAFEANRDAQHGWFASGQSLELKEYLSSLPNLREAVIQKFAPFHRRAKDKPFWDYHRRQMFVGPDAWSYGVNLNIGEDHFEGTLAVMFLEAIGYRNTFAGMRPVETLSLDLVTKWSLASLRALVTNEIGSTEPINPSTNPLDRLGIAVDAFRPLKHLSLTCPHVSDHVNIALDGAAQETQALLAAATELRTLTLEYGEPKIDTWENDRQYAFKSSLASFLSRPSTIYPHLQELNLTAAITAESFANFLGYHSGTLRVLELRDSVCDDWESVLVTISKDLNLQHVYLECLHEIVDEVEREGEPEWEGEEDEIVVRTVTYFWEGTGTKNDFNTAMKEFLLEGKGAIPKEFYKQSCVDVD